MRGEGDGAGVRQRPGSPRPVFILTPMPEEAAALGEDLGCQSWLEAAGARFALGSGPYRAVAVGISGMGKVAAAIAAQYACNRWQPWLLLVSGVAGGVQPDMQVGDLVVPSEAIQHDYDARPFSPARSLIPHLGTAPLEPDHRVSAIAAAACERYLASPVGSQARDMGLRHDACRVIRGAALTGDQVITAGPVKQELVSAFPRGACADMETAAIAQVARQNEVAWAAVRMISDTAEDVEAEAVFEYLTTGGAKALSSIMRETIDRLLDHSCRLGR
jgi:adenosylhomocysteine nucleosidase